ncbi:MAG: hypothetical protein ABIK28_09030, partial [Planctomycetota bacterium]
MRKPSRPPGAHLLLLTVIALALLLLIVAFPVRDPIRDALPSVTSFDRFFALNARYIKKALDLNPEAEGFLYHQLRTDPGHAGRSLESLLDACWHEDAYCAPLVTYYLQVSGTLNQKIPFSSMKPDACQAIEKLCAPQPVPMKACRPEVLCELSRRNLQAFPDRLRSQMADLMACSTQAAAAFESLRGDLNPQKVVERLSQLEQDAEGGVARSVEEALKKAGTAVSRRELACAWFSLLDYCDCLDRVLTELHGSQFIVEAKALPESDAFPPGILYVSYTDYGTVLIGGPEDNLYPAGDAFLIIDLGGNDTYLFDRSLVADRTDAAMAGCCTIIDLNGNDFYTGGSGVVAAGILGFGTIADLGGHDLYRAGTFGLGAGFMGLGLLIDTEGDDGYVAGPFSLGAAVQGIGLVMDEQGDDVYKSGSLSQAFAGPLGMGCLIDSGGYDMYDCVSSTPSGMKHRPGFSQACFMAMDSLGEESGTALLLDLDGDDRYHCDIGGQGAALGRGVALLLDARGYDIYYGRT